MRDNILLAKKLHHWIGANILSYGLAAANTQVVGALVAFFVNRICETTYEKEMKNDLFYLIGHSLGAHTMGYAGKRLVRPRVGRITALDPAGISTFALCFTVTMY